MPFISIYSDVANASDKITKDNRVSFCQIQVVLNKTCIILNGSN